MPKCIKHGGTQEIYEFTTEDQLQGPNCPCESCQSSESIRAGITTAGEMPSAYGGDPIAYCDNCESYIIA